MDDLREMYTGSRNKEKAVSIIKDITATGTQEEVNAKYDKWAATYNEDMELAGSNVPLRVAAEMDKVLQENKNCKIMDLACGTGCVGSELKQLGYTSIDGLDSSKAMLKECERTGAYSKLILSEIGTKPLDICNDCYDAVLLSGALYQGHVSPECLRELIRITKPSGLVVIARAAPRESDSPEIEQLEKLAQQLQKEGKCSLLEKITTPMYFDDGLDGLIWMYSPL